MITAAPLFLFFGENIFIVGLETFFAIPLTNVSSPVTSNESGIPFVQMGISLETVKVFVFTELILTS